jgi:hypothetical protein
MCEFQVGHLKRGFPKKKRDDLLPKKNRSPAGAINSPAFGAFNRTVTYNSDHLDFLTALLTER